jgi:hypothetical protein
MKTIKQLRTARVAELVDAPALGSDVGAAASITCDQNVHAVSTPLIRRHTAAVGHVSSAPMETCEYCRAPYADDAGCACPALREGGRIISAWTRVQGLSSALSERVRAGAATPQHLAALAFLSKAEDALAEAACIAWPGDNPAPERGPIPPLRPRQGKITKADLK